MRISSVLFSILLLGYVKPGFSEEPKCTSKFDYDYKMLQKIVSLEEEILGLGKKFELQQSLIEKMSTDGTSAVYIRWGRNNCHKDAQQIYAGYIGGKKYSDKGSGSNSVCLPSDPSWHNFTEGVDEWRGRIYGTETDIINLEFAYQAHNQDTPCALCKILKYAVFMIPGRASCYSGLQQEYSGYLMSAYHNHNGPHNYICVDSQPDFIPNGGKSNGEHVLYPVESICGSLPCPPYVNGRELACVVCSV